VFWWFERSGEFLRLEVLQLAPDRFELRMVREDGTEIVEMFSNAQELGKRQADLQREVRHEGWNGPHGWVM
jgi:hypothetical protein